MDAILGRDEKLVKKLADAAALLSEGGEDKTPAFAAIVGTPVPAVIGTDFRALERMSEKKTGLPCIGIACDGMEYYDKGAEKAYLALFEKFAKKMQREMAVSEFSARNTWIWAGSLIMRRSENIQRRNSASGR